MASSIYNFAEVKTIIYWDLEECPIPDGLDANDVSNNIRKTLAEAGYFSWMLTVIKAFCDVEEIDYQLVSLTQVSIYHIPKAAKEQRLKMILVDFLSQIIDYYQPLNLMLILGNINEHSDFLRAFNHLKKKRNFNVLLIQRDAPSKELVDAVSRVWLWSEMDGGSDEDNVSED